MKTTKQKVEAVAAAVGGQVYAEYSGRGMYGRTCFGVVCADEVECIEAAAKIGLRGAKVDSMGRDAIVYWPNVVRP